MDEEWGFWKVTLAAKLERWVRSGLFPKSPFFVGYRKYRWWA